MSCRQDAQRAGDRPASPRLDSLAVMVLLVVNTLAKIGPDLLFSDAADAAEDRNASVVYKIGIAAVGIGIAFALSGYLLRVIAMGIAQSIVYLLRRRIFLRLTNLGIDFYDRELPGEVAARVVNDLDIVLTFLVEPVYRMISALATFAIGLTVAADLGTPGRASGRCHGFGDARRHHCAICRRTPSLRTGTRRPRSHCCHFRGALRRTGRTSRVRCTRKSQSPLRERCVGAAIEPALGNIGGEYLCRDDAIHRLLRWGNSSSQRRKCGDLRNGCGGYSTGRAIACRSGAAAPRGSSVRLTPNSLKPGSRGAGSNTRSRPPIRPIERQDAEEAGSLTGNFVFESVSFTYPNTERPVLSDTSFHASSWVGDRRRRFHRRREVINHEAPDSDIRPRLRSNNS